MWRHGQSAGLGLGRPWFKSLLGQESHWGPLEESLPLSLISSQGCEDEMGRFLYATLSTLEGKWNINVIILVFFRWVSVLLGVAVWNHKNVNLFMTFISFDFLSLIFLNVRRLESSLGNKRLVSPNQWGIV